MTEIVYGIGNGVSIEIEVPDVFECSDCGCDVANYIWVPSNKSIQMRCAYCDKFIKNVKYDNRTKEQIRKEAIRKWSRTRNRSI